MNRTVLILPSITLALFGLGALCSLPAAVAYNMPYKAHSEAPIINPPKWEYWVGGNMELDELTKMGNQGWELCSVNAQQGRMYFKRRHYVD